MTVTLTEDIRAPYAVARDDGEIVRSFTERESAELYVWMLTPRQAQDATS